MNRNARILIAGAGPTGLTTAIELARRGLAPHTAEAAGPLTAGLRNIAFRVVGHLPAFQRPILERAAGIRE